MWKWTDIELTRLLGDALSLPGAKLASLFIAKGGKASITLDPGSIAANLSVEVTATVTGATVGMGVVVQPPVAIAAGLIWSARVSAANTVAVRIENTTASAIDPVSASWNVWLLN